jgi:hypothetical protein
MKTRIDAALHKLVSTREELVRRYLTLQEELRIVRSALASLPKIGHYRPQVELSFCKCGAGPFSARELRKHKCEVRK